MQQKPQSSIIQENIADEGGGDSVFDRYSDIASGSASVLPSSSDSISEPAVAPAYLGSPTLSLAEARDVDSQVSVAPHPVSTPASGPHFAGPTLKSAFAPILAEKSCRGSKRDKQKKSVCWDPRFGEEESTDTHVVETPLKSKFRRGDLETFDAPFVEASPLPEKDLFSELSHSEQKGILTEWMINICSAQLSEEVANDTVEKILNSECKFVELHEYFSNLSHSDDIVAKILQASGSEAGYGVLKSQSDDGTHSNYKNENLEVGDFVEFTSSTSSSSTSQSGKHFVAKVVEIGLHDRLPRVRAKLFLEGHEVNAVALLRDPGLVEKSRCGQHFLVKHPAAKAVLHISSGQRWVSIRRHGGEKLAYAKAQNYLNEWRNRFESLAKAKENAILCLCPRRPCPHIEHVSGQDENCTFLHCPGFRIVKGTSFEHKLFFGI